MKESSTVFSYSHASQWCCSIVTVLDFNMENMATLAESRRVIKKFAKQCLSAFFNYFFSFSQFITCVKLRNTETIS